MARGKRDGLLIAGGGTAGCLAALAMARMRPDVPLLIVEERDRFGGDAFHWFADAEIDRDARPLIAPLVRHHWPGYYVAFPGHSRKLRIGMAGFGGKAVHAAMVETLRPEQYRLGTKIVAVRDDTLVLDGGETIKADGALDARGAANHSMLELLHAVRVEREYRTARPHGLDRPVLIDATIESGDGLIFVQAFPLATDRLILSEIQISDRAQPAAGAPARLDTYASLRGWRDAAGAEPVEVSRPLVHGGDVAAFWRIGGARVGRLGLRGGFHHPLTGRAVADAAHIAMLLTRQASFAGADLDALLAEEARRLWRHREPQRDIIARIAAAQPGERVALLERLMRLDAGLIARLHTGALRLIDRVRLPRAFQP